MRRIEQYLITGLFLIFSVSGLSQPKQSFTNPLLPAGADPWSIYKHGYYYYTHTLGDRIVIWKTKNLANLETAPHKLIFKPAAGKPYSKGIWAPEIHYIQDKWYVYFAADSGKNESHRIWVLENTSKDPFDGVWKLKGKIADKENRWAIDGSVFQHNDRLYMVWSGWEGEKNGRQDIYISQMKNPWTLQGPKVRLSSPTLNWERHGNLNDPKNPPHVAVNEGPQILKRGNKLFLVYSASGCWTEYYSLGMLTTTADKNLMDSSAWIKSPEPVFKASVENGVYAPGHNSFFKSPDGTEDWILYHANSAPQQGCGRYRSPRAQQFTWNADDTPNFGEPVKTGVPIAAPSENKKEKTKRRVAGRQSCKVYLQSP